MILRHVLCKYEEKLEWLSTLYQGLTLWSFNVLSSQRLKIYSVVGDLLLEKFAVE